MQKIPSDPLDWLDKYVALQCCNVTIIERVSGLSFAQVAAICEWPEDAQQQALKALANQANQRST